MAKKRYSFMQRLSYRVTKWIGSEESIIVHTIGFTFALLATLIWGFERVMLGLTTIVSLEAIYIGLFLQMTVNRHGKHLEDLNEDVDDILEDTEELTEEEAG